MKALCVIKWYLKSVVRHLFRRVYWPLFWNLQRIRNKTVWSCWVFLRQEPWCRRKLTNPQFYGTTHLQGISLSFSWVIHVCRLWCDLQRWATARPLYSQNNILNYWEASEAGLDLLRKSAKRVRGRAWWRRRRVFVGSRGMSHSALLLWVLAVIK